MGHMLKFLNYDKFMSLKIVLILVNSADPGEMPPYAAFHLGLHCLLKYLTVSRMKRPKYLFNGIQNEKG